MNESFAPIAVVGATGYVGTHLSRLLAPAPVVSVAASRRPPAEVAARILALVPRAVVNAAAVASIGACEVDPAAAARANADLPGLLAEAARAVGARFIHLSTDQVFDGRRGRYAEGDAPAPVTVYGRTKLEGERRVLERDPAALVLRLNLLYGPSLDERPSGSDFMIARARRGEEIPLFTDEFRSPLAVADAAGAIVELLAGRASGILHLGGPERLSRYELGAALLAAAGLRDRVRPASLAAHDGPPRTPDTSFDSRLAASLLSRPPRRLREVLAET